MNESRTNNCIEFIVKDTGVGMNQNQLKNISTAFYTFDNQNMNP